LVLFGGYWTTTKYLIDMHRAQLGYIQTLDAIKAMRERYPKTRTIYIEAKANGAAAIDSLSADTWFEGRIVLVESKGNKSDRAFAVVTRFERREVFFPDPSLYKWVKPLLTELELFPKSAIDDCVDVMTQFLGNYEPSVAKWVAFI
jgi:predicted phage terminase large subunit-like protein